MPFFSIIIPVYNTEKYLRECLDSVLNQTFPDWECICVDDGSTDDSGSILDEYARTDERFKVIHKRNEGVSCARNTALSLICGEYLTFVDSDDILFIDALSDWNKKIKDEQVDILVDTEYFLFKETHADCLNKIDDISSEWKLVCNTSLEAGIYFFKRLMKGFVCGKCYKSSIVKKHFFDQNIAFSEDLLFFSSFFLEEHKWCFQDKRHYGYRQHGGQAVQNYTPQRYFDDLLVAARVMKIMQSIGMTEEDIRISWETRSWTIKKLESEKICYSQLSQNKKKEYEEAVNQIAVSIGYFPYNLFMFFRLNIFHGKMESFVTFFQWLFYGLKNKIMIAKKTKRAYLRKRFFGKGNVLEVGKNNEIDCFEIYVYGNYNRIIIGNNCKLKCCNSIFISGNNNDIIIGNNVVFDQNVSLVVSEETRIEIGDECMFANGVHVRTTDQHPIFDSNGNRLNRGKSVLIGSHVWCGRSVIVNKGSCIHDGAIIGLGSVVTRDIPEKSIAVGVPAKVIKSCVTWKA